MNFTFWKRNAINTTTLISVNDGTALTQYLIDRKDTKYIGALSTCTINIDVSKTISAIALQGINLKTFSVKYSGTTFTLIDAATSVSDWNANSTTDLFLKFAETLVNTLTIYATANNGSQYELQQIWALTNLMTVERNPNSEDYTVARNRKEYLHQLSGGGYAQYIIDDYFDAEYSIKYISETEKTNYLSVYNQYDAVVFTPFATGTSWDSQIYECIWTGAFDFIQRSFNDPSAGYEGSVKLRETGR